MQNCPKKIKKPNSVESRSGWWRQAYPRTALESTELFFLFFLTVLHLGDIHYGIIGFIGTVIGGSCSISILGYRMLTSPCVLVIFKTVIREPWIFVLKDVPLSSNKSLASGL